MAAFLRAGLSAVVSVAAASGVSTAAAVTISAGGLEFSDEQGGFVLHSVTGTGDADDPFVIVEEITGDGPAILTVRGLSGRFGNSTGSNHFVGMAVVKIVRNGTGQPWPEFMVELQEVLGRDSTYGDGLSFGQGSNDMRSISADRYARVSAVDEPRDGILFADGLVLPGEEVRFTFTITENSPRPEFFLVQRRQEPVAAVPSGRMEDGKGQPGAPPNLVVRPAPGPVHLSKRLT